MEGAVSQAVCQEKHKNIDEKFDRDEMRLNAHSKEIDDIKELTREVASLAKQLSERSKAHDEKIDELMSKPGKRWDLIVASIISSGIGAGVAMLIK